MPNCWVLADVTRCSVCTTGMLPGCTGRSVGRENKCQTCSDIPNKVVSCGFGLCCNHLITFLALQKFCSSTLYVAFRCPLREVGRKKTIYVFNTEVI